MFCAKSRHQVQYTSGLKTVDGSVRQSSRKIEMRTLLSTIRSELQTMPTCCQLALALRAAVANARGFVKGVASVLWRGVTIDRRGSADWQALSVVMITFETPTAADALRFQR